MKLADIRKGPTGCGGDMLPKHIKKDLEKEIPAITFRYRLNAKKESIVKKWLFDRYYTKCQENNCRMANINDRIKNEAVDYASGKAIRLRDGHLHYVLFLIPTIPLVLLLVLFATEAPLKDKIIWALIDFVLWLGIHFYDRRPKDHESWMALLLTMAIIGVGLASSFLLFI
jgi:hypothetical protein